MSKLPDWTAAGMKLKSGFLLPGIFILSCGMWIGSTWSGKNRSKEEDLIIINSIKFRELLSLIHTDYIDKTDTDSLADAALGSLVDELDPHSVYISKKDVFEGSAQLESHFEGIGAEFQFIDDTIWVSTLTPGSPAEKAGLLTGDRILKVNRIAISGVNISHQEITKLVRGPKGSQCMLEIQRSGVETPLNLPVIRDKIQSRSLDYAGHTESGVGFIKCSRFTQTTAIEMREALIELLSQGMKSLVLDLRDNPGGYVSAAIKVADEFLPENQLIVYTEGRNTEHNTRTLASSVGLFERGNLVVLVNENTASAAEIVTGSLQDNDRALVVGRRSFGKGLVQAPITLTDGSMVRLTISRYFSPSGRCIQKGFQRRKRQAFFRETESPALLAGNRFKDSLKTKGRPVFKTRLGRKVLGGGGINPDFLVLRDSLLHHEKVTGWVEKSMLQAFVLKYFNTHRRNLETFNLNSGLDRDLQQHLISYGTDLSVKEFERMKPALHHYLKSALAKCLWGYEGFFKVMEIQDNELKKALSLAPKSGKTLDHLTALKSKEPKHTD
jgi:carboxyl-terminal processing protease